MNTKFFISEPITKVTERLISHFREEEHQDQDKEIINSLSFGTAYILNLSSYAASLNNNDIKKKSPIPKQLLRKWRIDMKPYKFTEQQKRALLRLFVRTRYLLNFIISDLAIDFPDEPRHR